MFSFRLTSWSTKAANSEFLANFASIQGSFVFPDHSLNKWLDLRRTSRDFPCSWKDFSSLIREGGYEVSLTFEIRQKDIHSKLLLVWKNIILFTPFSSMLLHQMQVSLLAEKTVGKSCGILRPSWSAEWNVFILNFGKICLDSSCYSPFDSLFRRWRKNPNTIRNRIRLGAKLDDIFETKTRHEK